MFSDLVLKARTVRRFVECETIGGERLESWVDLARQTPSAGNLQPLRYRIVSQKKELEAMYPLVAWAGYLTDWKGPEKGERPNAFIIILSDAQKNSPDIDLGIAAQTIQLAAASEGYGCCMMGAIKRDEIHNLLKLPENLAVRLALALGRPAEEVVMDEIKDQNVKYWRDHSGIHHVPKRPLGEVLIKP